MEIPSAARYASARCVYRRSETELSGATLWICEEWQGKVVRVAYEAVRSTMR